MSKETRSEYEARVNATIQEANARQAARTTAETPSQQGRSETSLRQEVARSNRENELPRGVQDVSPSNPVAPHANLPTRQGDASPAPYQGRQLGNTPMRSAPSPSIDNTQHGRQMANFDSQIHGIEEKDVPDVLSRDTQEKTQQNIREQALSHNQEPSTEHREATQDKEKDHER